MIVQHLGHLDKRTVVLGSHPGQHFGRERAPRIIRRKPVRGVAHVRHGLNTLELQCAKTVDVRDDLSQIAREGLNAIGRNLKSRQSGDPPHLLRRNRVLGFTHARVYDRVPNAASHRRTASQRRTVVAMKHRAGPLTRIRHGVAFALARPVVMIALAAALSFEITTLPIDPVRDGGESIVGRFVARAIAGKNQVVFAGAREIAVFLAKDPSAPTGFEVIDPDAESMDRVARLLRENSSTIAPVGVLARPVARGWWRPTRVDYNWTLRAPSSWTDQNIADASLALANYLEAQGEPELTALARAITDQRLTRVRWIGYAHNTLDATLLIAFFISCGWILPGSGWRTRRSLRRTKCPSCGYSLKDLEPADDADARTQCPECGSSWNLVLPVQDAPAPAREQSHRSA